MSMIGRLNGPVGNGRGMSAAGEQGTATPHGTQGLIQLCVIVTKDEIGYGLTVSGDKPVHVQSVKENGASAKAGVKTGDRIYKVNGTSVANCDHTEVVSLIKAGSHVALTLLRKPEKEQSKQPKMPTFSSGSSIKSSGSDKITHPMPADVKRRKSSQALQEQMVAKEKIETVRKMYEEALATENKLHNEYSKTKSHKTEAKLQDAKKTTGAIRHQLESLTTTSAPDMRNCSSRKSICLGELSAAASDNVPLTVGTQRPLKASWSMSGPFSSREPTSPRKITRTRNMSVKRSNSDSVKKSSLFSQQAVSMPASVDYPDSCVLRTPTHNTIGESSALSDDTDDEPTLRRSVPIEHRDSLSNPRSEIFSMEEEDFSPESQTVVKDHGPFVDFELLRHKHAHCSVFLSFLISNGDPAPMLFTLTSEIYMNGSVKDMKRWAYEIHSTFIIKDAPLDIKLDDSIVESIDNMLKSSPEKEEPWKNIFRKAKVSALDDTKTALADFRQKRELGLGNFFGDGELKFAIDKTSELRIIERTLRPHYEKFCSDTDSIRSQALSLSLATVMKEWGVHKGGIDRQLSFAMKDFSKSSFKSVLGARFKKKETKNHVFNPHMYYYTTFCDQCAGLIWGIGFQGYTCSNCDMNIHKECLNGVEVCKKKKKKRASIIPKPIMKSASSSSTKFHVNLSANLNLSSGSLSSTLGVPPYQPKRSHSFGSAAMLPEELKEVCSPTNDEDSRSHSVAALAQKFEPSSATTNGESRKSSVNRTGSFHKKSESVKSKDSRRAKSDVDKDGGEKIMTAIDASRSSSSASSLSNRSDSSSNERVNDLSLKTESIDEEGDSDLDVEDSMPPLDSVIRKENLRKMKPKEKKLQEVINELLYTEKSHVRNLKILDLLFHRPMVRAEFCSKELVDLVFPDIKSLIDIHVQLNNEMKAKMKDDPLVSIKHVAHMLLNRFDGEAGEKMKEVCALFCRNHSYALNALKEKQKRDTKLQELVTAGETDPRCRRLQFKDLMISEVHRLTKYPLLIDSMCNHTTSQSEEHRLLSRATLCSRNILAHVNHAVKDCENHHKLVALQKKLDTRPIQSSLNPLVADYKNLNLQDYKLVYEGALTWRLSTNRSKQIDLHVILLEEMLVLLQVQDDGRLVLKCQSQIATQSRDDSKFGHSPIITLNSMLVRQVATDKKALFIINTSQLGPQIYDLVANSVEEKKRWFKYISEAADSQKKSNTSRRAIVDTTNLTLPEVSNDESPSEEKFSSRESTPSLQAADAAADSNNTSEAWSDSPPAYTELLDSSHPVSDRLSVGKLAVREDSQTDSVAEVSPSKISQDDDGERDAKSLVLASISDTMLLQQFLSATAANAPLNAAAATSPTPLLSSPSAASKPDIQTTLPSDQTISVLNSLSRRLNCLLEVMEEHETERARLQHQLQTAEQLLRDTPKDMGDSRPNSFVSNSSSSASVGEVADSQTNAMTSAMTSAMPSVIKPTQPIHSAPTNSDITDSSSSSTADSDSDDEGTVNAGSKEDLIDAVDGGRQGQRPDSSLSNVSVALTDNTLVSVDNLSDDVAEGTNDAASDEAAITADTIPDIRVNSASSTEATDSDIENTNIDDIVADPADTSNIADSDSDSVLESEKAAAASIVEKAMRAALDIIQAESHEDIVATRVESPPLDCSNIHVDLEPDTELAEETEVTSGGIADSDIDDSDEADALSASSLD